MSDWSADGCSSDLSGVGKARRHLVGDALDAGAARDEAVLGLAFGTEPRRRHDMAAMMAGEPVDEPMLDHPCGAVRALDAVAAGAAQGTRREAAAVEEQKALLALAEPGGERVNPRRRKPAVQAGRVGPHELGRA